ncbi:MAG: Rieske (2Fe-2S) protein [Chitinivibrionales bacterium]|nr:Rieske (2Fe-2S) protein [Chitinivibrionales bacterium]
MSGCCHSRREFLIGASKVVAVAGVVATGLTTTAGADPVKSNVKGAGRSSVIIDLQNPANAPLATVGGAVFVDDPTTKGASIIVLRSGSESITALSAVCTHKGGPVEFDDKGVLTCKLHKAQFDIEGKATKEPAKTPLKKFQAVLQGNMVIITL